MIKNPFQAKAWLGFSHFSWRHSKGEGQVPVVPIDENGIPIERSFTALSRDISTSGICLQHTRATNAKQLIIVLSIPGTKPAKLIVEVVRCRAIGRFYEIAAKFTSRVAEKSEFGTGDPSIP